MNRKNKDGRPLDILLVDDFNKRLGMLADTIADLGCKADIVNTYEGAIDNLNNHYDLMVIDHFLHSGDMAKRETGHDIKEAYLIRHPNSNVKIIQYSGNVELIEDEQIRKETVDSMQVQEMVIDFIESRLPKENAPMQQQQGDNYNSKLCDERHVKLDKSIDRLNGILNKFSFLFIGAIVSSAFAIVLSCIKIISK